MPLASDFFDFNEDHGSILSRACHMQGPYPSRLAKEIQAGLTLADFTDHQYLWLGRTGSYAAGAATPTNAARTSCGVLRNPGASGKICRLRRMILGNAGAGISIFWNVLGPNAAALPALLDVSSPAVTPRDSRIAGVALGGPVGACDLRLATTAGAFLAGEFASIQAGAAGLAAFNLDVTLAPGGTFWVFGSTVNVAFNLSLSWDERDAVAPELA